VTEDPLDDQLAADGYDFGEADLTMTVNIATMSLFCIGGVRQDSQAR
jgi:hypothetical protein